MTSGIIIIESLDGGSRTQAIVEEQARFAPREETYSASRDSFFHVASAVMTPDGLVSADGSDAE